MEQELAYSFHLGSDKNKSKLARKVAKETMKKVKKAMKLDYFKN